MKTINRRIVQAKIKSEVARANADLATKLGFIFGAIIAGLVTTTNVWAGLISLPIIVAVTAVPFVKKSHAAYQHLCEVNEHQSNEEDN